MLKIPLETYNTSAPSDATVELDDERGRVRLTIDLDPAEFVHRIPDFEEPVFVGAADRMAHEDERDHRIEVLEEQNAELRQYRDALWHYAADLRGRLEAVKEERDLSRDLLPDEARSLAAALWHFAGEVDAWARRA